MQQPIPNKIKSKKPEFAYNVEQTLLLDMNSIMKMSMVDKRENERGEDYGMVYQTLLQIKIALKKGNFDAVYAFYDGDQSGILRYKYLKSYKENRQKNYFDYESEHDRKVYEYCKSVMKNGKNRKKSTEDEERFGYERSVVIECLENLYIRNVLVDFVEGDDLIAYYVLNKRPKEKVMIVSSDRDLTQLISDDVSVYIPKLKTVLTPKNHSEVMGISHKSVLIKKIICGDSSDNVKGIKGVGEKTFMDNFPEVTKREVLLDEIIEKCKKINEERKSEKKKPLMWAENIINSVTEGEQGGQIYEINDKLMNLRKPLLTDEGVAIMNDFMSLPLDSDGRGLDNLYKTLMRIGVNEFKNEDKFSSFFSEFMYIVEKEKKRNKQ